MQESWGGSRQLPQNRTALYRPTVSLKVTVYLSSDAHTSVYRQYSMLDVCFRLQPFYKTKTGVLTRYENQIRGVEV